MAEKSADGEERCPFLQSVSVDRLGAFPLGVWCALPSKRLRAPSRDELQHFCREGHHYACTLYRSAKGSGLRAAGEKRAFSVE